MLDNRTNITVPLRVGPLFLSLALLCFLGKLFLQVVHIKPISLLHIVLGIYSLLSIISFMRACVNYSFTNECLVARFLGIPFRFIPWENIGRAQYLHAWRDILPKYSVVLGSVMPSLSGSYGQMIYVTLKRCPAYVPEYHVRLIHNIIHPFRTACIWLPYKSKDFFIDSFKKCYPNLEIQPIDAWKRF